MKIAIMQPYLFPYIGYFQLIDASDRFGIYSHVQYIKKGWINRNKILINKNEKLFSFSLKKASYTASINEKYFSNNVNSEFHNFLKMLQYSYKKSPFYPETIQLIEEILSFDDLNVSNFILNSLKKICGYLNIKTKILDLPSIENNKITASERVINLCHLVESEHYINPIGGINLYNKDFFKEYGITLNFLKPGNIIYRQFDNDFIPNLSIIDVMMLNSPTEIRTFLQNYKLI